MAAKPRLCITNLIQATGTTLTASSSATGSSVSRLTDQLRSKTWRSATGWTIVAGKNTKIDFNRGGVLAATVAEGTYATGAALASAIVTALEAADATPVWACSYDAGTKKFTISSDLAFTLLFSTGTNFNTSIHVDLGYASSDTGSATSHTAGSASYQSRRQIAVDFGAAATLKVAIVINHNAGTGGTFTFQAAATSFVSGWGYGNPSVTVSQALSGDADIRIAFFASQSYQYARLLINDVQNTLGYSEVGIFFAGSYTEPSISYGIGFTKAWEELSEVSVAIGGAHFQDEKPRRPTWRIQWLEAPAADVTALAAAFALVPKGRNFFLAFDPDTTPTDTAYGFLTDGVVDVLTSNLYHDISVQVFAGALG